jgi:epoxyqueuosine reductase QueG
MIRKQIETLIHDFWADSPQNSLNSGTGEKAWDAPLIGYASAADPLFAQIKADIGPFYWLPTEAFALAFPDDPAPVSELSVVVWILPQTEATLADQSEAKTVPAERWARSRDFGEKFNCALRLHVAENLTANGLPAVAPERLPGFDYRTSEKLGIASNWSERHTAYIAGLGTFGLSDGLITERGKAVRIGSVVVRTQISVDERPYADNHQAWCLWYAEGRCGACIRRCPPKAITPAGHDKARCFDYIREVTAPHSQSTYGTAATPCGLCQVDIPCMRKNPMAGRRRSTLSKR